MSYRYRYTGDVPAVFVHVVTEDGTWAPSFGDEVVTDTEIVHPHVRPVVPDKPAKPDPDVAPETSLPATADGSKEIENG